MTVGEFAARYRIKFEVEPIPQPPDAAFNGNWYQVTLYCPRGAFRENYGLGFALTDPPTLEDVLADMARNAQDQDNCPTWTEWSAEYGSYDKTVFRQQRESVRRLRDLLGDKALTALRETDYT